MREMEKRCYFKRAFDLLRNDNVNEVRTIYWFNLPIYGMVERFRDRRLNRCNSHLIDKLATAIHVLIPFLIDTIEV